MTDMGMIKNITRVLVLLSVVLSLGTGSVSAAEKTNDSEPFNVGDFIFEHIEDAYSWHICTIGATHVSIPLPVILYSSHSGWHCFFSSHLQHEESTYQHFTIASEGANENKIVEILPDGTTERPIDISITKNVLALFFSIALLIVIFLYTARTYVRRKDQAPSGIQNMMETIILFIRDDIAIPTIGKKKYERYMPYLLTVFFFILLNNLLGLIPIFPGGANITGNITVTMALALCTFFITNLKGTKEYWKDIFNTPGVPTWLKLPLPIMPVIEVVGVFTKPIVLMIRLFANITAGHIVMMGFFSLIFVFGAMNVFAGVIITPVSILFTMFMTLLELLVAFIQAYVFTLLSSVYFGFSAVEHHESA